jgi:hypothetical protein
MVYRARKRPTEWRDRRGRVHEARNYEKNLRKFGGVADEPNVFRGPGLGPVLESKSGLWSSGWQYGGSYVMTMGGLFVASLLLLNDLWNRRFHSLVRGQYIVAIPSRDILAFGDSSSDVAMVRLRALARRSMENELDRVITSTLHVRIHDMWQPVS